MARLTYLGIWLWLLVACTASNQQADELAAHVGKSIQDVTEAMGRPSSVYNMQDGTYEYIWRSAGRGKTGIGIGIAGVTALEQTQRECRRVLVTNEAKIVIDYKLEGKCR